MQDIQSLDTRTLLALDACAESRAAAASALRELYPNARIVEAPSQTDAAKNWNGPLPALAVVAFELEGQNGLEAAAKIVKLSPATRVVVYAAAMPETVRRALTELGCGFMGAPASAERILNALDCCAAERAKDHSAAAALAFA